MRRHPFARSLVLALFVTASSAFAATYPVRAQLRLAPKDRQQCLSLPEGPDCSVVELARSAFAAAAARMFVTSGSPDLILVLEVRQAEVSRIVGVQLDLATRVTVESPGGDVIDVIDSSAAAPVLVAERGPLLGAARAAAADAALDFERSYASSSKIGDYLVGKKVAPASAVAVRERSDKLVTVAVGLGFVQGSGDSSASIAPSVRVAWSYGWFFAQGTYTHYAAVFDAVAANGDLFGNTSLDVNDFGIEAGFVWRLPHNFEVRAAPGLHVLAGTADAGDIGAPSFTEAAPVVYGSITNSFIPFHGSPRIVAGVEARGYFFTAVALPEVGRKLPIANSAFALTLGLEFPWSAQKEGTSQ
ncbi:MAG TPA: hypothetical protein VGH20_18820 [Myxococcales bacterium]|jgi:hypothetical protein